MRYSLSNGRNYWNTQSFYQNDGMSARPSQARSIIKNHVDRDVASTVYQRLYNKSTAKGFLNQHGASSLMLDAFNHWYQKGKDYDIQPDKYWWHSLLQKVDNHLLQFATNGKTGFSYAAASHVIEIINKLYKEYGDGLKDKIEEYNEALQNGKPAPDEEFEKKLDSASNSAKNRIRKDLDNMEKNSNTAGKGNDAVSIEMIDMLIDPRLSKLINIKQTGIKEFLKTTIDRATESISGKAIIIEESIFDSENIDDLINIENFAHVALYDDLTTRTKKYNVSFDVYIDDSGSMDSRFYLGDIPVVYRNLARMLAFKLLDMQLLRDCYLFSHNDTLTKIKHEHLFSAHIGGGTDIAQCVYNAQKTGRPAIIVTDGWDRIPKDCYYKDCFILILDCITADISFKKFAENKQILFYDGEFSEAVIADEQYGNGRKCIQPAKSLRTEAA
jgi:hypothetical protein